jgi:hypothetical protein
MRKLRELEEETTKAKTELATLTGNDPAIIEAMRMYQWSSFSYFRAAVLDSDCFGGTS